MSWWWLLATFVVGAWVGFSCACLIWAAAKQDRERENAVLRARVEALERAMEYYRAVAEDAREQFNRAVGQRGKRMD